MLETQTHPLNDFVEALVARDFDRLQKQFTPAVTFRAFVPPGVREAAGAEGAAGKFKDWFGDTDRCDVLHSSFDTIGTKQHATYRLRVREDGKWYLCEQTIYASAGSNGIERMDLLCSGFIQEEQLNRL